jgi:hypothetical protein
MFDKVPFGRSAAAVPQQAADHADSDEHPEAEWFKFDLMGSAVGHAL